MRLARAGVRHWRADPRRYYEELRYPFYFSPIEVPLFAIVGHVGGGTAGSPFFAEREQLLLSDLERRSY